MEVTDLRIKNWVQVENDYEQVVAIDTYNVKCSLSKAEGVWQHKSDIHPIPLIERYKEWLTRFGFKGKRKGNKKSNDLYYYDKEDSIRIEWHKGDSLFFVSMGYDTRIENKDITVWHIIKSCKYVHELQNIYYALMNEELIYKK